ncbi:MAG: ABC transporter ATP-binding protein [Gammaproteobacteria bacterium]|nr:ABC transporter ATP-binding protein [Gammaproteobacteria bacterium]MCY4278164.1 ABC transporter ATP-binding protein [Gammaproteobacteria bacterium]
MTSISLKGVTQMYGSECAIHTLDLEIASGEFVVFLGPSGCGKSTLLRMIAGLEQVASGRITFDEVDVTSTPAAKRGVAMVFQSYALYPHMTVSQNLSFGLRMTGHPRKEIARRVERAVNMLKLGDYLQRKPAQLSGGECQRVAIGRAIVQEPRVLLSDEPLSNLDAELRSSMRVEIAALHRELGNTMVYVTHDQVEAMTLADRIVVLNDGRIEQVGTPDEIYRLPKNVFVAGFVGAPKINMLSGVVVAAGSENGGLSLRLPSIDSIPLAPMHVPVRSGDKVSVGIRPEDIAIDQSSKLHMLVSFVEQIGGATNYFGDVGKTRVRMSVSGAVHFSAGDRIPVRFAAERFHYFDADGQRLTSEAARA